ILESMACGTSAGNGSGAQVRPPSLVVATSLTVDSSVALHVNPLPVGAPPFRFGSDANCDSVFEIASTARLDAGNVGAGPEWTGPPVVAHSGGFWTVTGTVPSPAQRVASRQASWSDHGSTPNPVGKVPFVHGRPPSVVTVTTAVAPGRVPAASATPTATLSTADGQLSESIESPARIGFSVKVLPPSDVTRKVASRGAVVADLGRPEVETAASPPQDPEDGQESACSEPTPVGSGLTVNAWPPSDVVASTACPSKVPPAAHDVASVHESPVVGANPLGIGNVDQVAPVSALM
ncbi:MAG: hypothetical protein ACRDYD_10305, partial [Acidimicrobiales bacterium]